MNNLDKETSITYVRRVGGRKGQQADSLLCIRRGGGGDLMFLTFLFPKKGFVGG